MPTSLVTVRLVGLRYVGPTVGQNLTIECDLCGVSLSVNKRVAASATAKLNMEIGQFLTDAATFPIAGTVRVVERDPLFNDVGVVSVNARINLASDGEAAEFEAVVPVTETGGKYHENTASFIVLILATATRAVRYVPTLDEGWLRVVLESNGKRIALPTALRVNVSRISGGREYFVIAEGANRGLQASVSLLTDGSSRFESQNPHRPAMSLIYSKSTRVLSVVGKKYPTRDYPLMPWSKGTYDVEIPDAPHSGGLRYPEALLSRTWFRVGHTGDRYIHTGAGSLGCITVLDRNHWDALCSILMRARKGDNVSIRTVTVVD